MIEQAIEIRTADGTSDGFIYRHEGAARCPGVIHLTDIGGIRPSHREMARRLADKGYTVMMPNVFYRTGKPPMFTAKQAEGEERMKRFAELAGPLTPDAMERDAAHYVDFLAADKSVSAAPMGVVGYCFTGAMALRTATIRPDKIGAVASFHGGRLFTDGPSSPHLVLPRVKARLYFGHAIEDRSMPADAIGKFEQALKSWGGKYERETYPGSYHGWTERDSPVYNRDQAERAFEKLPALFEQTLR
jgi:carboxymethylenebutenolidase